MIIRNVLSSPLILAPRVSIAPGKTLEIPEDTRFGSTIDRWLANGWVAKESGTGKSVPAEEPKAPAPKVEEPKKAPARKNAKKTSKKSDEGDK